MIVAAGSTMTIWLAAVILAATLSRRSSISLGQRFGGLTVERLLRRRLDRKLHAECRCDCGTTTIARVDHLLAGHTRSCGCGQRRQLAGQRFGLLQVLDAAPNLPSQSAYHSRWGRTAWRCRCACGRIVVIATSALVHPRDPTWHCGCQNLKPAAEPLPIGNDPPMPVAEKTTGPQEALDKFHSDRLGRPAGRPIFHGADEQPGGVIGVDHDPFNY